MTTIPTNTLRRVMSALLAALQAKPYSQGAKMSHTLIPLDAGVGMATQGPVVHPVPFVN